MNSEEIHEITRRTHHWTSADGEKRKISELSDSHIHNLIPYISSRAEIYGVRPSIITLLEMELAYRATHNIFVPEYGHSPLVFLTTN